MYDFRYILAIIVVVVLPPALIYWFIVHPLARYWRRLGPAWTISIVSAALSVLMAVLWIYRAGLLGQDLDSNLALMIAGAVILSASWWIAFLRQKHLTLRILVGVPELETRSGTGKLLTQGIYAKTRNPRYLEVFFGILGFALIANFFGAYMTVLLSLPTLQAIVLIEERELRERFGEEYVDYCRRVPRWLPLAFAG